MSNGQGTGQSRTCFSAVVPILIIIYAITHTSPSNLVLLSESQIIDAEYVASSAVVGNLAEDDIAEPRQNGCSGSINLGPFYSSAQINFGIIMLW
jgi:hypothetical protein